MSSTASMGSLSNIESLFSFISLIFGRDFSVTIKLTVELRFLAVMDQKSTELILKQEK